MFTPLLLALALSAPIPEVHRPVPSPDGSKVALTLQCGEKTEAIVVSIESGKPQRLAIHDEGDWYPHWSPGGSAVVLFRGTETAESRVYRIVELDLVHGTERDIFASGFYDGDPDYSPDGRHIVFNSDFDGDHNVYTMSIDGTHIQRLSPGAGSDFSPNVHPDGEVIVYVSRREDGKYRLVLTDLTGTRQDILDVGRTDNYKPHFSPDGDRIVFFGPVPEEGDSQYDVFSYDLVARELTRLTNDKGFDGDPKWMPDGDHILYVSSRDGHSRIWKMRPDGSEKEIFFPGALDGELAEICNSTLEGRE